MILLELIFSIVLFSILATYSTNIILTMQKKSLSSSIEIQNNIRLETTRLFIIKHNNLIDLKYSDKTLYFKNNILLDDISSYTTSISNHITTFNVCIKDTQVCQSWKIKTL